MIVMHACQCEKPAPYARFGRFGRSFRDETALVPPSEETIDGDIESFEVPSPAASIMELGGLQTVVKSAVVFWVVTRILDHVFLGKEK